MYQISTSEVSEVAGGGWLSDLTDAYLVGVAIGDAINSAVEAVGGWEAYFVAVGEAGGSTG